MVDAPPTDSTPKNIIIADFFLPYICCGNGDMVNMVLSPAENPSSQIHADFKHPDFDENDFSTDKPQV